MNIENSNDEDQEDLLESQSEIDYYIVNSSDGDSTIVLIIDGIPEIINDTDPNYVRIGQALVAKEYENVRYWMTSSTDWFLNNELVRSAYNEYDYDFSDDNWFEREDEAEAIIESLSDTINRYRHEGRDPSNLVAFMSRLAANPSRRSRDQLFNWTQIKKLTIDNDGFIIGFKGVRSDMLSISSGQAFVNDVEFNGNIPNAIGTVISMPRDRVQDDPTIGCSYGLHIGNWSYANAWGELTLEVKIDPADVVSVPVDCNFQKLRCCRYEVIAIHTTDTDDLDGYEPDATDTWDEDEAIDGLVTAAPGGFWSSVASKIRGK